MPASASALCAAEYVAARSLLEQSAALYRICGHKRRVGWCYYQQARLAWMQEQWKEAGALLADALAIFRDVGDLYWVSFSFWDLAHINDMQGDAAAYWLQEVEHSGVVHEYGPAQRVPVTGAEGSFTIWLPVL